MALLIAAQPRRRVVGHLGWDDAAALRALVAVETHERRCVDASSLFSVRSWAAVPVDDEGLSVGTLLVADRRRRWFDDEEVRHLGLMTDGAAELIAMFTALDLSAVDVTAVDVTAVDVSALDVRERDARLASQA